MASKTQKTKRRRWNKIDKLERNRGKKSRRKLTKMRAAGTVVR